MACFFFFQAEDGIRDRNVTGVQTCVRSPKPPFERALIPPRASSGREGGKYGKSDQRGIRGPRNDQCRSEERRVGKECRSGGSTEEEKKNGKEIGMKHEVEEYITLAVTSV